MHVPAIAKNGTILNQGFDVAMRSLQSNKLWEYTESRQEERLLATKLWGRLTLKSHVGPSAPPQNSFEQTSIAMLHYKGEMEPAMCFQRGGDRFLDPPSAVFGTRSGLQTSQLEPLETRVPLSSGTLFGDVFENEVYKCCMQGAKYCMIFSSDRCMDDFQTCRGLFHAMQAPEDTKRCYVCSRDFDGQRIVFCDHCGRAAHTTCVHMPFERSHLDDMDLVELRCERCAARSGTIDMVAHLIKPRDMAPSIVKISPLFTDDNGAFATGLSLVRIAELEVAGGAPSGGVSTAVAKLLTSGLQQEAV